MGSPQERFGEAAVPPLQSSTSIWRSTETRCADFAFDEQSVRYSSQKMIPYGVIPRILAAYFLMICGTCRSSGRVEAHSAMGRFQFLWYEYENVGRLIDQMGFAARYSKYGSVGRDSTGERLFLDFRATE